MKTKAHSIALKTPTRESEGKRTTAIRPVSLRRAQIVSAHIGNENITDFISNATDERTASLVKKLKIQLPADCEFTPKP